MRDTHLIKIFDPAYYQPGIPLRITKGDKSFHGLIMENEDDLIRIVFVKDSIGNSGELENELRKVGISVNDVESEEYFIDFLVAKDDNSVQQPDKQKQREGLLRVYNAFCDLSTLLSNQEHIIADANGITEQDDIEARHEARIRDFCKLIKAIE